MLFRIIPTGSRLRAALGVVTATAVALTLGACGGEAPPASALAAILPPATFRGTLPCADCPGIRTTLELNGDGTASLSRMYIEGEPDRDPVFVERGRWSVDDDGKLVVTPPDGPPMSFAIEKDGLTVLDGSGQPLPPNLPRRLLRVPDGEMGALAGTFWRFVEPAPVADAPHLSTLGFSVDAHLTGSDGCNVLSGPWHATEGHLELGPVATTRMACPGPIDATAQAIQRAIATTAGYAIEGSELHLLDADGAVLARLRPAPPPITGGG